jgi:N-acylglucosamine-6-phosphate 2-epimerase
VPALSNSRRGAGAGEADSRGRTAVLIETLQGALIVSCQASPSSPMRDTATMVRVARSALQGGAQGLRVNGPEDISAIRAVTDVPIIGLFKEVGERRNVITVRPEQAQQLARAGADIIAIDATAEVFENIPDAISRFAQVSSLPIMADVSNLDEGMQAWEAGAFFVGTTLSGYTPYSSSGIEGPDIALVEKLSGRGVRVVAEGRYSSPELVRRAFDAGAFAVVVGGAITDPVLITRRFNLESPKARR